MSCRKVCLICVVCLAAALPLDRKATAAEPAPQALQAALRDMHQWMGTSQNLEGWRDYLLSDRLEAQLAPGATPDPAAIEEVLRRYRGNTPGLDNPRVVRVRQALQAWLEALRKPSPEDLVKLCQSAKGEFSPLDAAKLQEARKSLQEAVERLDKRLAQDADHGASWREFLLWPQLQEQLAHDPPDLSKLDAVYAQFASGQSALGLVWFGDVRLALRGYLIAARVQNKPELQTHFVALMDRLASQLDAFRQAPSTQTAAQISDNLARLEEARQVPKLREAVHRCYASPNVLVRVSAGLIATGIASPVEERSQTQDTILQTSIQSDNVTRGRVDAALYTSPARGEIDIAYRGTTESNNSGYHSTGTQISSIATTQVESHARLCLEPEKISILSPVVHATTATRLTGVNSGRGGRGQQEAWSRAQQQQPQAQAIAAQRAEQHAAEQMEAQLGQMAAALNQRYQKTFRQPALDRGVFPQRLEMTTTPQALHLVAMAASSTQLAAPSQPPSAREDADLVLQLHESALNNVLAQLFGGMSTSDEEFAGMLQRWLGTSPAPASQTSQEDSWTVGFVERHPVAVSFAQGVWTVTFRGDHYLNAGSEYPGMNITLAYRIVPSDHGFKAVRQGEVQVVPPDFTGDGEHRLSTRQQVLRRLLERRLAKASQAEFPLPNVVLPEPLNRAGELSLVQCECDRGWLVMAWKRPNAAPKESADAAKAKPDSAKEK